MLVYLVFYNKTIFLIIYSFRKIKPKYKNKIKNYDHKKNLNK